MAKKEKQLVIDRNKSIQEIENDYWPDEKEYASGLVERCHEYRKIKIGDLHIHQLKTLLIQDIGAELVMPIVLKKMEINILEEDEDEEYGGSLLDSLDFYSDEIFKRRPDYFKELMNVIEKNQSLIEKQEGERIYERIVRKLQERNAFDRRP